MTVTQQQLPQNKRSGNPLNLLSIIPNSNSNGNHICLLQNTLPIKRAFSTQNL